MKKIIISGDIGWDNTADSIREQLDSANGEDLDVKIASPGGSVMEGLEIFNLFRDYKRENPKSQIIATLSGFVASMGTYLAVNPAFDLLAAEDNAVFMIHNVWGFSVGDYIEMRKTADIFEGLTDLLADMLSRKSGSSKKETRKSMDKETWLFGEEILEAGFIDEIIRTDNEKEKASAIIDARSKFEAVSNKILNTKIDTNKIAACLRPDKNYSDSIEDSRDKIFSSTGISGDLMNDTPRTASQKNENTPAIVGNNKTEDNIMTLEQLLNENPAAKIEHENALKNQFNAGLEKSKAEYTARVESASKFLDSAEYPSQIKAVAVDVIQGKKSLESLETMVASVDMIKELKNTGNAKDESDKVGDTPGDQGDPETTKDGVINSEADYQAELKRAKGGKII